MKGIGKSLPQEFSKVRREILKADKAQVTFFRTIRKNANTSARRDLPKVSKEYKKVTNVVDKSSLQMAGAFRGLQGAITTSALTMGLFTLSLGNTAKGLLDSTVQMERYMLTLKVLEGDLENAKRSLKELLDLARLPGIMIPQAAGSFANLRSVGISGRFAIQILEEFSNATAIAGGTATDLRESVRQLSQSLSIAKIDMENWRVILERMPTMREAIQKTFGPAAVHTVPLNRVLAKEGLSAEEAWQQIFDQMELTSRADPDMTSVIIENFQNAMFELKNSLGSSVLPQFKAFLKTITDLIDSFNRLSEPWKKFIGFASSGGVAVAGVSVALWALIKLASKAVQALGAVGTRIQKSKGRSVYESKMLRGSVGRKFGGVTPDLSISDYQRYRKEKGLLGGGTFKGYGREKFTGDVKEAQEGKRKADKELANIREFSKEQFGRSSTQGIPSDELSDVRLFGTPEERRKHDFGKYYESLSKHDKQMYDVIEETLVKDIKENLAREDIDSYRKMQTEMFDVRDTLSTGVDAAYAEAIKNLDNQARASKAELSEAGKILSQQRADNLQKRRALGLELSELKNRHASEVGRFEEDLRSRTGVVDGDPRYKALGDLDPKDEGTDALISRIDSEQRIRQEHLDDFTKESQYDVKSEEHKIREIRRGQAKAGYEKAKTSRKRKQYLQLELSRYDDEIANWITEHSTEEAISKRQDKLSSLNKKLELSKRRSRSEKRTFLNERKRLQDLGDKVGLRDLQEEYAFTEGHRQVDRQKVEAEMRSIKLDEKGIKDEHRKAYDIEKARVDELRKTAVDTASLSEQEAADDLSDKKLQSLEKISESQDKIRELNEEVSKMKKEHADLSKQEKDVIKDALKSEKEAVDEYKKQHELASKIRDTEEEISKLKHADIDDTKVISDEKKRISDDIKLYESELDSVTKQFDEVKKNLESKFDTIGTHGTRKEFMDEWKKTVDDVKQQFPEIASSIDELDKQVKPALEQGLSQYYSNIQDMDDEYKRARDAGDKLRMSQLDNQMKNYRNNFKTEMDAIRMNADQAYDDIARQQAKLEIESDPEKYKDMVRAEERKTRDTIAKRTRRARENVKTQDGLLKKAMANVKSIDHMGNLIEVAYGGLIGIAIGGLGVASVALYQHFSQAGKYVSEFSDTLKEALPTFFRFQDEYLKMMENFKILEQGFEDVGPRMHKVFQARIESLRRLQKEGLLTDFLKKELKNLETAVSTGRLELTSYAEEYYQQAIDRALNESQKIERIRGIQDEIGKGILRNEKEIDDIFSGERYVNWLGHQEISSSTLDRFRTVLENILPQESIKQMIKDYVDDDKLSEGEILKAFQIHGKDIPKRFLNIHQEFEVFKEVTEDYIHSMAEIDAYEFKSNRYSAMMSKVKELSEKSADSVRKLNFEFNDLKNIDVRTAGLALQAEQLKDSAVGMLEPMRTATQERARFLESIVKQEESAYKQLTSLREKQNKAQDKVDIINFLRIPENLKLIEDAYNKDSSVSLDLIFKDDMKAPDLFKNLARLKEALGSDVGAGNFIKNYTSDTIRLAEAQSELAKVITSVKTAMSEHNKEIRDLNVERLRDLRLEMQENVLSDAFGETGTLANQIKFYSDMLTTAERLGRPPHELQSLRHNLDKLLSEQQARHDIVSEIQKHAADQKDTRGVTGLDESRVKSYASAITANNDKMKKSYAELLYLYEDTVDVKKELFEVENINVSTGNVAVFRNMAKDISDEFKRTYHYFKEIDGMRVGLFDVDPNIRDIAEDEIRFRQDLQEASIDDNKKRAELAQDIYDTSQKIAGIEAKRASIQNIVGDNSILELEKRKDYIESILARPEASSVIGIDFEGAKNELENIKNSISYLKELDKLTDSLSKLKKELNKFSDPQKTSTFLAAFDRFSNLMSDREALKSQQEDESFSQQAYYLNKELKSRQALSGLDSQQHHQNQLRITDIKSEIDELSDRNMELAEYDKFLSDLIKRYPELEKFGISDKIKKQREEQQKLNDVNSAALRQLKEQASIQKALEDAMSRTERRTLVSKGVEKIIGGYEQVARIYSLGDSDDNDAYLTQQARQKFFGADDRSDLSGIESRYLDEMRNLNAELNKQRGLLQIVPEERDAYVENLRDKLIEQGVTDEAKINKVIERNLDDIYKKRQEKLKEIEDAGRLKEADITRQRDLEWNILPSITVRNALRNDLEDFISKSLEDAWNTGWNALVINPFAERTNELRRDMEFADSIAEVRENSDLTHTQRTKQIEQMHKDFAKERIRDERRVARERKLAWRTYAQTVLTDMGKIIMQQIQLRIATKLTNDLLNAIGIGSSVADIGSGLSDFSLGGFFSNIGNILGVTEQKETAESGAAASGIDWVGLGKLGLTFLSLFSASKDSPRNDMRIQMAGLGQANQFARRLGQRTSDDMDKYFVDGFRSATLSGTSSMPGQMSNSNADVVDAIQKLQASVVELAERPNLIAVGDKEVRKVSHRITEMQKQKRIRQNSQARR